MEAPERTDQPAKDGTSGIEAGRRLSRRSLFVTGAASAAAAAVAADTSSAAADESGPELPQMLGHVTKHVSSSSADAHGDDEEYVRLKLAPGARVERHGRPAALADYGDGDWFIAVGETAADGSFHATRVIPAVLGEVPPASR